MAKTTDPLTARSITGAMLRSRALYQKAVRIQAFAAEFDVKIEIPKTVRGLLFLAQQFSSRHILRNMVSERATQRKEKR